MEFTIADTLHASLAQQRQAYLDDPIPSYQQRRYDLLKLRDFIKQHQDAICAALHADYGQRSTHETLLLEIYPVLDSIKHALKSLRKWMRPQRRAVDRLTFLGAQNRVLPQPLGVIGVIVPWNFPINLSLVPLVAILAAGNRAMIKLSENSRRTAALLIKTMPQYFPAQKIQFFDETGGVGIEFSKLPFDHLLFTGSGQTGKAVMQAAAANLCPVTLELGGKSPAIVFDDFPICTAAERILFVKCLNAGQICTTVDYVWLPLAARDEFVNRARQIVALRYADLNSSDYTSIIDARSYQRLLDMLDEARRLGAQVLPLLEPAFDEKTRKIAPHLVLDLPADCALLQREIFGPVLPIRTYSEIGEVVYSVNAGPRPLALYPFSHQTEQVQILLERIMSGGVTVNDALLHVGQADLPFGGVGASGMGHYHGWEGFQTFSKLRPVFYQSRLSTLKWLSPPYKSLADRILKFMTR